MKPVVRSKEVAETRAGPFFIKDLVGPHLGSTRGVRVGICTIEPGQQTTFHRQPAEEVFYVLAGQGNFRVGNERHEFAAGDCLYVSADVGHQIVNTGSENLQYLYVVVPPIMASEAVVLEK